MPKIAETRVDEGREAESSFAIKRKARTAGGREGGEPAM